MLKFVLFVTIAFNLCDFIACDVAKVFRDHEIVPDILDMPPVKLVKVFSMHIHAVIAVFDERIYWIFPLLQVTYPGGFAVHLGNKLTPCSVFGPPRVKWDANQRKLYTLILVDLDVKSRAFPTQRSYKQWVVINIPGDNVVEGNEVFGYVGAAPIRGTRYHRYVFLVYEQPDGRLDYDRPVVPATSGHNRTNTDVMHYTEKFGLRDPIFGNFFVAIYDQCVPLVFEQIGEPYVE